jgi:hypothetical protein
LLRQLLERRSTLGSSGTFPFRYVMSDLVEGNVDFWKAHPKLRRLVDAGHLDFARYDIEASNELHLEVSGDIVSADRPAGPLVALANYIFDSIPIDLFAVQAGVATELRAAWRVPERLAAETDPRTLFESSTIRWDAYPMARPFYDHPPFDRVLEESLADIDQAVLSMPIAALRTIDRLRELAGGELLVLASDKGYVHDAELARFESPSVTVHGSVSTEVNFNAISRYVGHLDGVVLGSPAPTMHLCTSVLALGAEGEPAVPALRRAAAATVGRFSPDEFYAVNQLLNDRVAELSFQEVLAHLRLSRYDMQVLLLAGRRLAELLPGIATIGQLAARDAIWRCVVDYFPIGEPVDVYHAAGVLLALAEAYEPALVCFDESIARYGPDPVVVEQAGRCRELLAR